MTLWSQLQFPKPVPESSRPRRCRKPAIASHVYLKAGDCMSATIFAARPLSAFLLLNPLLYAFDEWPPENSTPLHVIEIRHSAERMVFSPDGAMLYVQARSAGQLPSNWLSCYELRALEKEARW